MTWVAVAIGGSALLGAFSSDRASDAQVGASAASDALQKQIFDKQTELNAPFREAGLLGQNRLMDLLGLSKNVDAVGYGSLNRRFGDTPFTEDPSYKFRLKQGQLALDRSASARGGLFSGRAAKDLTDYGQGTASQEYGNAFNRFQTERSNTLNPLQSVAGMAQTATQQINTDAGNYGKNVGNSLMGAGDVRASGYVGTANAISGGVGQGLNYLQNQNMMNRYFPSGGTRATYPGVDASSVMA